MIRQKIHKHQSEPIVIDLTGPDGNAYYLLALVRSLGKQISLSEREMNKIELEMKSSDYEHLVKTFDFHFGQWVVLER